MLLSRFGLSGKFFVVFRPMYRTKIGFDPFEGQTVAVGNLWASILLMLRNLSVMYHVAKCPITAIVVILLTTCGVAKAAALVGETHRTEEGLTQAPALDRLLSEYRRPSTISFPPSNPYTFAKASLGRSLFFDTRLSGNGALSCASCHNPGFSFGDGLAKSLGNHMNPLDRRSPSILNSAWGSLFMWDGRATSLENQVAMPIESPTGMNQRMDTLVHILSGIGEYRSLFAFAFPDQAINSRAISAAIATYERTIVSATAPFDSWIDGNESALPDSAKRGFVLFNSKAACASCHSGWLFTDNGFHDVGLPDDDTGRGRLFPKVLILQHAFKTPSLRETARRAPYMHDGSLPTLEAVVTHYNQGGINRPSQSKLVTPLGLSQAEQADIVAFLRTLTSAVRLDSAPELPR
jgi:cytochrome c peroxidase